MMIKKTLLLFALMIVANSCKENKTNKTKEEAEINIKEEEKDKVIEDTFLVKLKGVFTKDDKFQVFYTEDKEQGYTSKKVIKRKFLGSNEEQEIVFEFPKEIYPSKIRLDLGSNKEQGTIIINYLTLILDGQSIEISNQEFLSYFKPNDWVNQTGVNSDSEYNLVVKDVMVTKSKKISYDPYFNSTAKLISDLESL